MTASLPEIAAEIADTVSGVAGLRAFPHPPQGATPPLAWVEFDRWDVETFGRLGTKRFTFRLSMVFPTTTRDQDGYNMMLNAVDHNDLDSESVWRAIFDAQTATAFGTLEGVSVTVIDCEALGSIELDGLDQYGAVFTLQVATKGRV